MLRLAFDFIITWRETRTRPNAYYVLVAKSSCSSSKVSVLWGKDILFPLRRYRLIAWDDTSY